MNLSRCLWLVLFAVGCSPLAGVDGGIDGGQGGGAVGGGGTAGGGTGAGGGGGTGGGGAGTGGGAAAAFDAGTFTFSCVDGGAVITDAGIDQSALSGAACEPGDLDALIQQCRVEPVDYFFDYRCPGASTAAQARIRELFNNSGIYSCSAFGRDLMRCVAPRAVECAAADGGTARDLIAQRIVSECNASVGGPRINLLCDDACNEAHTACFSACRACTFESCALCSFNCGKQFVACRSRCPPP